MTEQFDVFADFATNPDLEVNGTWFDLGKGASILVARADNWKHNQALGAALEQHQEALGTKDQAAHDLSQTVMAEVFAKSILLGWKGMFYKGAPIDYSHANALTLLSHTDFRVLVGKKASQFEAYKVKVEVEQGKV